MKLFRFLLLLGCAASALAQTHVGDNPQGSVYRIDFTYPGTDVVFFHLWREETIGTVTTPTDIQLDVNQPPDPPYLGPYSLQKYVTIPDGKTYTFKLQWQLAAMAPFGVQNLGTFTGDADAGGTTGITPTDPPAQKYSELLLIENSYNKNLKVTFKDAVTGDTISSMVLSPGEKWMGRVKAPGDHNIQIVYTLTDGAAWVSTNDLTGEVQGFLVAPGTSWNGSVLDHSDFTTSPPAFEAETALTVGKPSTGVSVDPAGPHPTAPPSDGTRVTDGRTQTIRYSTTVGTGGATDATAREGFNGVVQAVDRVKASVDSAKGSVDTVKTAVDEVKEAIAAGRTFTSAETTAEQSGNQSSLASAATTHGTAIGAAYTAGAGNSGSLTAPSAGTGFSFGTISNSTLGLNLFIKPFDFMPDLVTYAHWIREILLWMGVFAFARYSRDQLEKYMALTLLTPQVGTMPGPVQTVVPGVGLAKQIGVAAGFVTIFVAAIGTTIGLMNSNLAGLIGGTSIGNVASGGASAINALVGSSAFAGIYGFCGEFVPFAGWFQLFVAEIVFSWSLPTIWAAAYSYAKFVRP